MSKLVCVSCRRVEGHTPMCEGGGYDTRESLAAEADALRTHERDHLIKRSGCEFCQQLDA
ncbi:hypothetical protein [Streptosporangium sandarakinum]|uniref:hypothetical protein n=1 Tax=Streptosporangium sandarakinum TaxID=1260955 RepID=UPI00369957E6